MIFKLECGGDCKTQTAAAARLKELLRERRALLAAGERAASIEEIMARVRAEAEGGLVTAAAVSSPSITCAQKPLQRQNLQPGR